VLLKVGRVTALVMRVRRVASSMATELRKGQNGPTGVSAMDKRVVDVDAWRRRSTRRCGAKADTQDAIYCIQSRSSDGIRIMKRGFRCLMVDEYGRPSKQEKSRCANCAAIGDVEMTHDRNRNSHWADGILVSQSIHDRIVINRVINVSS
jgi:hypothetical protein